MAEEQAPRRRYMYVELDEDVHRSLCRRASFLGVNPVDVLELAVIQYINSLDQSVLSNDDVFFIVNQNIRDNKRRLMQVRNLAWHCLYENGTETDYDTLNIMCEAIGCSPDEIIAGIINDKETPPIIYQNDYGVTAATQFLSKYMVANQNYAASDILAHGKSLGFSESVLNQAKRRVGIKSINIGKKWYWCLMEVLDNTNSTNNTK